MLHPHPRRTGEWIHPEALGFPAARIDIEFDQLPHTVPYMSSRNEGLGWGVAADVLVDRRGRLQIVPGKRATIRKWLSLEGY